eukprot:25520-Eustigmatos_ZCMA.PRE.1
MARTPSAPREKTTGPQRPPSKRKTRKPHVPPLHYVDGHPVPEEMLMVTREAMCLYDAHKA